MEMVKNDVKLEMVLHTLAYFSVFSYPLKPREIQSNCSILISLEETQDALKELMQQGKVFGYKNFFTTDAAIKNWVDRRLAGNRLAAQKIAEAASIGRFIFCFPFVRFVGISGSLSKGFALPDSDFDFFILTSGNRLWICRTILHVFKKITFLFGMEHKFCMNYFIDVAHLQLEEKNIFTAIELSSLLPVSGSAAYEHLMMQNDWVKDFLPNDYVPFHTVKMSDKRSLPLWLLEVIFFIKASSFNKWLMKMTDKKWKQKWKRKNYPAEDYPLAFKTTLYHSKKSSAKSSEENTRAVEKKYSIDFVR